MQIIASYIELIVIYNSTTHISVCKWFFSLKLKLCMDKNFLPWLFPDLLKNPWLSLTSLTEWKPSLLGWWEFKGCKPRPVIFYEHPGNSTSFLGATRNSVCSWKNVMTFCFYDYSPFKNVIKILMKIFCLLFSFHDM